MYIRTLEGLGLGLGQPQSVQGPIPKVLWSESGLTLYVEIDLRIGLSGKTVVPPLTGIFCPENYRPVPKVDLIVYLHGQNEKAQCFKSSGVVPIDIYWKSRTFCLREKVNNSGKNVILVAPTLGQISEAGELIKPGGFDNYLDQVLAALIAYGPYKNAKPPPMLGNVILAGHSGGGRPMLTIASSGDRYTANIRECWGFDSLYSGRAKIGGRKLFTQPDEWLKWAGSNKTKYLFIYYKDGTQEESKHLDKEKKNLTNLVVNKSTAPSHCPVPITHFGERLQGASFLSNR